MKRFLTLLLALTMILSLCACGTAKKAEKETEAEAPKRAAEIGERLLYFDQLADCARS